MNIIACCKIVPEEQDIFINADGTVNTAKASPKISQYDLNALEAAVELAAGAGGTVTVLSAGVPAALDSAKVRKDILSRGADSLSVVVDAGLEGARPARTAAVLAEAARNMDFDLILCGEGSGDLYAQQVGILLGEALGVPCINAVSSITLADGIARVERALEKETQVLEIPLPAVLSVTSDINTPRIPSMKSILGAGKKPVNAGTPATGDGALSQTLSVLAPEQVKRLGDIIEGDSDENIAAFAEKLRKIFQ